VYLSAELEVGHELERVGRGLCKIETASEKGQNIRSEGKSSLEITSGILFWVLQTKAHSVQDKYVVH
jgi:hypothetical protein